MWESSIFTGVSTARPNSYLPPAFPPLLLLIIIIILFFGEILASVSPAAEKNVYLPLPECIDSLDPLNML